MTGMYLVQGDALQVGGYEHNPVFIKEVIRYSVNNILRKGKVNVVEELFGTFHQIAFKRAAQIKCCGTETRATRVRAFCLEPKPPEGELFV